MRREDFFYELPEELIAQAPVAQRDHSRLLVCKVQGHTIEDKNFYELPELLSHIFSLKKNFKQLLCVVNDSRVYPARVRIARKTGARGEVFLLETGEKPSYACLLRPKSKLKVGEILYSDCDNAPLFKVECLEPPRVSLMRGASLQALLEQYGEMPLPPYIERDPNKVRESKNLDKERYQTVYCERSQTGSSAAPTAGLHFTSEIMEKCERQGVEFAGVTLHVGLGTFAPVQSDDVNDHIMHEEHYCVSRKTFEKVNAYLVQGFPIVFVGTTSLRAMESFMRRQLQAEQRDNALNLAQNKKLLPLFEHDVDQWHSTNLFIFPQNKDLRILPCIGNGIITNFHQPESTLSMLIAALMGYDFWQEFYQHAIAQKYRFFSYGDSSLLVF